MGKEDKKRRLGSWDAALEGSACRPGAEAPGLRGLRRLPGERCERGREPAPETSTPRTGTHRSTLSWHCQTPFQKWMNYCARAFEGKGNQLKTEVTDSASEAGSH